MPSGHPQPLFISGSDRIMPGTGFSVLSDSARDYGIIGHDIFSSGYNLDVVIKKEPGAFCLRRRDRTDKQP